MLVRVRLPSVTKRKSSPIIFIVLAAEGRNATVVSSSSSSTTRPSESEKVEEMGVVAAQTTDEGSLNHERKSLTTFSQVTSHPVDFLSTCCRSESPFSCILKKWSPGPSFLSRVSSISAFHTQLSTMMLARTSTNLLVSDLLVVVCIHTAGGPFLEFILKLEMIWEISAGFLHESVRIDLCFYFKHRLRWACVTSHHVCV